MNPRSHRKRPETTGRKKGFVDVQQKFGEGKKWSTYRAISPTFSSFRHCSADKSIALALGTSNLRARKNLYTEHPIPHSKNKENTK